MSVYHCSDCDRYVNWVHELYAQKPLPRGTEVLAINSRCQGCENKVKWKYIDILEKRVEAWKKAAEAMSRDDKYAGDALYAAQKLDEGDSE